MRISPERLAFVSQSIGFAPDVTEKAIRSLSVLEGFTQHPALMGKLALKGGAALNLFLFDMPRLSVDVDLNYVGAIEREAMLAERPEIERGVQAVVSREGFVVKRAPAEHAGGKWRCGYLGANGQPGNLEIDLNFVYRVPLFGIHTVDSKPLCGYQARAVPMVDVHELAAGKLAALFARTRARDVFDARQILSLLDTNMIDRDRLRLAFVVYGAGNRKDWRTIDVADIAPDPMDAARELAPLVRSTGERTGEEGPRLMAQLVAECREKLSAVLPFTDLEREFLELVLQRGRIEPALLTSDLKLQERIRQQSILQWKIRNVQSGNRG